jgi:hypothetical protein
MKRQRSSVKLETVNEEGIEHPYQDHQPELLASSARNFTTVGLLKLTACQILTTVIFCEGVDTLQYLFYLGMFLYPN